MKYAAVCCTVKDEDIYLKEWLTYHACIGFEHFILYDNCSTTPVAELLRDFDSNNMVTVHRHEEEKSQYISYTHCLKTYSQQFAWIAFIDTDEFIRLRKTNDIRLLLSEYEKFAALGLTWRMFSSNGHEDTPLEPVIQSYTKYLSDNVHIKSIVQPSLTVKNETPHSFSYKKDTYCVDTNRMPLPSNIPFAIPRTDCAYINHYFYKSRQCFAAKVARGNPCSIERSMAEFDDHLRVPSKKDLGMLPYIEPVVDMLNKNTLAMPEMPPLLNEVDSTVDITSALLSGAKELLQGGNTTLARLYLCYASAYAEKDDAINNRLWTLKAEAALIEKRLSDALLHAEHALSFGASLATYIALADILMQQKRVKEAKYLVYIMNACKNIFP